MKKLIAILLALVLVLSFAACANNDTQEPENNDDPVVDQPETNEPENNDQPETNEPENNDQPETNEPENNDEPVANDSALDVLKNIWAKYGEEEMFPIMGGNPEAGAMEPAVWANEYLENLTYTTNIPADLLASVADAATMIHMMNANTFTAAAYHLNEGVDAAAFAQSLRDGIMATQWMCGFPETLVIAVIGDVVLAAYGVNDAMTPFSGHLTEAYADAQIVVNEPIA